MIALDPNDPALHTDPYPAFSRLREEEPVHWSPAFDRWLITRHSDVLAAYRSPQLYSSETFGLRTRGTAGPSSAVLDDMARGMLFRDPPDHTRLRKLVSRVFTPRTVQAQQTRIAAIARDLLDDAAASGPFDLVDRFAAPLPLLVIAEMVGVPMADRDRFRRWGDHLAAVIEPGLSAERRARSLAGTAELRQYLHELVARRRRRPEDDLLSGLVAAEENGESLTVDEILGMVMLLTTAGHETTTSLLVNCVRLLVEDDAVAPRLPDPAFRRTAIEEVLRYEPPIQFNTRVLTEDVTLHGVNMPKGSGVGLVVAAANRDPRVFADPERFDPDRADNPHLSFASGIHVCLGASLSRLEADIALAVIARDFPTLRTVSGTECRKDSATLHGFTAVAATI